ncbi:MAG: caspase family protein [Bacteroidota bacterium]
MQKKSLIIGINNYKYFSSLENCINDASDMHSFLSSIGFQSTLLIDSSQDEIIAGITEFKQSISDNTISIIFFAGHGIQDEKYNYLVASDSQINSLVDIKYNCIHADDCLGVYSKTNLHLLILDACRNNPFYSGNRSINIGLIKMDAPAGTLIAFSTSPNSTSRERKGERNGVYTKFLLKNMRIPNLPAELVFKNTRNEVKNDTKDEQIPWEESSLFGDNFSFVETENETIDKLFLEHMLTGRLILLPELMPFLKNNVLESESLEVLILTFCLAEISFFNEQEGNTLKTVDEDYFYNQLFDNYYPLLDERLKKDNNIENTFNIEIFDKIKFIYQVNFGSNSLNTIDESFPQMIMNYIEFNNEKGILCFYVSTLNDKHFLKPTIITTDQKNVIVFNYSIITGDEVIEITDRYFNLRKPFEKEVPLITNNFRTSELDNDDFENI